MSYQKLTPDHFPLILTRLDSRQSYQAIAKELNLALDDVRSVAKVNGKARKAGKPLGWSKHLRCIKSMLDKGQPKQDIANACGCSRQTIHNVIKNNGWEGIGRKFIGGYLVLKDIPANIWHVQEVINGTMTGKILLSGSLKDIRKAIKSGLNPNTTTI